MSNVQTTVHSIIAKSAKAAIILLVLAGLTGCSGFEGVEFQGKLFNAIGLGGKTRAVEPNVAQRNGLIVPPDNKALPAPGSGRVATAGGAQSWPQDPEDVKRAAAAREQAVIQKYCADEDWWKRSNPAEFDKMTQNGELCLSGVSKTITKNVAQ